MCTRPAHGNDLDHTRDWALHGLTIAANLGSPCRHCHRLKHEGGWRLTQPAPGWFRWTSRGGATYLVRPRPITRPLPQPRPRPDGRPRTSPEERLSRRQAHTDRRGDQGGDDHRDDEAGQDAPAWIPVSVPDQRRRAPDAPGAAREAGAVDLADHYPSEPPF